MGRAGVAGLGGYAHDPDQREHPVKGRDRDDAEQNDAQGIEVHVGYYRAVTKE